MGSLVADALDVSQRIGNSSFAVDWVLENLRHSDSAFQALAADSQVVAVTSVTVGEGKGFVSDVNKISIYFGGHSAPYDVILKVPKMVEINASDSKAPVTPEQLAKNHNHECEFYNKYAAHIDIPLARVFKTVDWVVGKQEGAILMESLVGEANSWPLWKSCDSQMMHTVAGHLAHLTVYFLRLPKDEWIGKYPPDMFRSFAETSLFAPFYAKLREMKPGVFDEGLDLFEKYARSTKFFTYAMADVARDHGLPPALSHGDLYANNMLWEEGTTSLAAILDWQIIQEGSLVNDLARFMTFCVDGELRREHERAVLEAYYQKLTALMGEGGGDLGFSFDQMHKTYKVNFVYQTSNLLMMGPILYPNSESSSEEKDHLDRLLLRCRLAMDDALEYLKEIPEDKIL